jgi:hypothetical protein
MRNINNWTKGRDGTFKFGDLAESEPMTLEAISSAKNSKMLQDDKKFLPYLLKKIAENSQAKGKYIKENIKFALYLVNHSDKKLRDAAISTILSFNPGDEKYGEVEILKLVKSRIKSELEESIEEIVKDKSCENKDEERQEIVQPLRDFVGNPNAKNDVKKLLGWSKNKTFSQKLFIKLCCDENLPNILGDINTLLDSILPAPQNAQPDNQDRSSRASGDDSQGARESRDHDVVEQAEGAGGDLQGTEEPRDPGVKQDKERAGFLNMLTKSLRPKKKVEGNVGSEVDGDVSTDAGYDSLDDERWRCFRFIKSSRNLSPDMGGNKAGQNPDPVSPEGDVKKNDTETESLDPVSPEDVVKKDNTAESADPVSPEGDVKKNDTETESLDPVSPEDVVKKDNTAESAVVTDQDKEAAGTTRAEARDYDDSAGVEEGVAKISSIKDRIQNFNRGLGENNREPSPPPSNSPTGTGFGQMKEANGQAMGL